MAGVITEIAAECGVSEQAVRAWCRRNHVAKDAKGSFAINKSQKTAIYQHYLGVERKRVSQPAKASCETCETSETALISMLQKELDRKNEQLSVKDKQIEELNARLAEVSSALVIPVATEQSRGLSTRVSMKQALKQQGFVGVGKKQTEWAAWMEREKEALTEIAQRHDFEIISLGTNRPHMDLPQFREAAARLEVVQQQTAAAEQEIVELERQRDALKGTVRLLKEADSVNVSLSDIQPEKTLTGAVKGVTVDQVEQLKKMALRSVTDRHKVKELTEENTRLRSQVPSMKKRMEEAQRQQRLEQENRRLREENSYLQYELEEERSFSERLTDGIGRLLDYLEERLPERLLPLLEKARELLPNPEIGRQQEQQQHQRGMGGMEL